MATDSARPPAATEGTILRRPAPFPRFRVVATSRFPLLLLLLRPVGDALSPTGIPSNRSGQDGGQDGWRVKDDTNGLTPADADKRLVGRATAGQQTASFSLLHPLGSPPPEGGFYWVPLPVTVRWSGPPKTCMQCMTQPGDTAIGLRVTATGRAESCSVRNRNWHGLLCVVVASRHGAGTGPSWPGPVDPSIRRSGAPGLSANIVVP